MAQVFVLVQDEGDPYHERKSIVGVFSTKDNAERADRGRADTAIIPCELDGLMEALRRDDAAHLAMGHEFDYLFNHRHTPPTRFRRCKVCGVEEDAPESVP